MKAFIILSFALTLSAQTLTMTLSGPATAKPGATVALTLSAAGGANTGAAALQWSLGLPAGYTATVTTPVAAKALTCTASNTFCLLVGQNAAIIPNGAVAAYAVKVPVTSAAGSVPIPLSGLLGATPLGSELPVTAGTPYVLRIQSKEDLNGDGTVTVADVALMAAQAISAQTNPAACVDDMNADSKCDVLDVFLVVLKSLGLI